MYDELMDPVTAFLANCVNTADAAGIVPKDQLYRFYFQFCKVRGISPITTGTFTKQLKPRVVNLRESRLMVPGHAKRQYCWTGISMAPDKEKPVCEECDAYIACVSTKGANKQEKAPTVIPPRPVKIEKVVHDPPDITGIRENPDIELKLISAESILDAGVILLENNENRMTQYVFRRKLEFYRHKWELEQDKVLRGDPRLRFMGVHVLLVEVPADE